MTVHHAHIADETLLEAAAGELPRHERETVEAHLAECATCADRAATLKRTADEVSDLLRDAYDDAVLERVRARLKASLHQEVPSYRKARIRAIAPAVLSLAAVFVAALWIPQPERGVAPVDLAARPVPALTPGAAAVTRADLLCAGGHTLDVPIPGSIRDQVLVSYGMQHVPADEYELDYLITPELGGATDPRNLWPQRYAARGPWNAFVKDELERLLPRLVCTGRIELATAQRDMAADWIAAYRKYFRTREPLRTHVRGGSKVDEGGRLVLGILPPKS